MTAGDAIRAKAEQLEKLRAHREKLYRAPELRQLFLELTLRCNANCFHCGSRCDAKGADGLPSEEYLRVLREVKEELDWKKIQICITGGEPMLRPDFFSLLGEIRAMGFHWGMTSNATLITREAARRLRETGMDTISVSIDGLEETHDRLRGLPGGYRAAMRGIGNLLEEGGFRAVQVTTVVNHESIRELDKLYEIFSGIDIDSWRVVDLEPIGRAKERPELMLTPEDHRRLFSFILGKRLERMPVQYGCSHFLGPWLEREVRDWYFLCNAGIYTASIMANGDIGACLDIPRNEKTVQGNIFRDRFTDVWRERFGIFRRPLSERNKTCSECPERKWCAGGAAHSWDYENECQQMCFKGELF